ncbi:AAA family ATPase [bacterium]|nr:AAA family ATPase [bacterium]
MLREELIKRSPIRILEKTIHGGLGKGNLGVLTARKGIGKTASLVHIAIDQLLRDKKVLHISFAEEPNHIKQWYKQVFNEISTAYKLDNPIENFEDIISNRLILHFKFSEINLQQIRETLTQFIEQADFNPDLIIIDGFNFYEATQEQIDFFKEGAKLRDAEIWFSSTLHREALELDDSGIPAPINRFKKDFAVIIMLDPTHEHINFRLLKDHDSKDLSKLMLKLDPKTLLIANHRA